MTEQMRREALMAHSKEELVDLLLTFYHDDVAIKFELMDFMNEREIDQQLRIEKARRAEEQRKNGPHITSSMNEDQIRLALGDKADITIYETPLMVRSINCLNWVGYTHLIDVILLVYERPEEFRSIKNLKDKQAVDILKWLYSCGVEIPECYSDLFEGEGVGLGTCE